MATATEMAREAKHDISLLRLEFRGFADGFKSLDIRTMSERLAVLEEKVGRLEKVAEEVKHVPAILDRLNKLEEEKRESYKRVWQFFFLLGGVVLGVVGNLIAGALKPNGGQSK